jgi:uncharacterized protein YndB with AHSA1/START domain
MQARASTLIARPPDEVFAFMADQSKARLWRSHLTASRGTVTAAGDVVTQTYTAAGQTKTVEFEVAELAPPERLTFRLRGPVRARLAFQCRPESGGTRVSISLSAELTGFASLAEGRAESELTKLAHADLAALKHVLESGA